MFQINYNLNLHFRAKISVTRLGIILMFLVTNFLRKVGQILSEFLGFLQNTISELETTNALFGQLEENLGYFIWLHLVTLAVIKCCGKGRAATQWCM